jgi:hypothetical protein
MHSARIITLLSCVFVVAAAVPAPAGDGAPSMIAVARARAEASPEPPVERPDLQGLTVPDRLFYMRATDHIRCVRAIADVTGDGHDEVIVGSWENAVIVLNGLTGAQVWKTPVGTLNGGDVWFVHSIDDLNADGYRDVVAGSFDTYAYAMDGVDGTDLWAFPTNYRVYSVYPVGDLNADGTPEVAVGNQNQSGALLEVVHVLDGSDIPAVPDFTLAVDPALVQICAGNNAEYTVTVGAISGFAEPVTLAAVGSPADAGFSVNPVTPPDSSLLTIGNTGGVAEGSYPITISGAATGSPGHSVQVGLDVLVPAPPPSLTAPPNGAIVQPLRPTFQWSAVAGVSSYALEVDDDPAFASPAISETGIAGTSFTPSSDLEEEATYHWRVRSENACGPGTASIVFSFMTGSPLPFEDGFESGDTSAWSATLPC